MSPGAMVELAEKAGLTQTFRVGSADMLAVIGDFKLAQFAALVIEECAKVCDGLEGEWAGDKNYQDVAAATCASVIRALIPDMAARPTDQR
jgi:hypothetical protein